MEALDPPLPADSLTKMYQFQDSISARGDKVDSLYALYYEANMLYRDWIFMLNGDTVNTLDELRDSLVLETYDPGLLLLLADLYIIDSMYTEAEAIWDTVPKYSQEVKDWVALRQIQLVFEEQGWNWTLLEGEGEASGFQDDIEALAASNTAAGLQARHILYAFQEDSVPLIFEQKDALKKGRDEIDDIATKAKEPQSYIKVFPNPTANTVTIEYDLAGSESATFKLFDLLGNLVKEVYLDKPKGEVALDVSSYPIGTYLYQTTGLGDKVLPAGRLLIIR